MSRNILVVAHPDDEILWLSGAMAEADKIIFAFGDQFGGAGRSAARRRAVAALPVANLVALGLTESGVRQMVDWQNPRVTPHGLEINDAAGAARYAANYDRLVAALRPHLTGCENVTTHNPWGEYGHPEHVQLYRAVNALQAELGFTIWFSNYVAPLSWGLAQTIAAQPGWAERAERPTNKKLARRLFWIYWRHGAWTWPLLHRWPAAETYFAQPPGAALQPWHGATLLDVSRLRWGRFGSARRVLA